MTKRLMAFLLAALLTLALAGCGGKEDEKPSGGIADIGGGGAQAQSGTGQGAASGENADAAQGQPAVEVRGDKIIATANDGMGTTTITEYSYKDGALAGITMTFEYADAATAANVYKEMKDGSLKTTAEQSYASFKQDGSRIVATMADGYAAAFYGMSQEEMAAFLRGEEPTGSAMSGASVGVSGAGASAETTINTSWASLELPEGFPQLAEGVTGFSTVGDNMYAMDWNVLPREDAEAMVAKLESWSGATAELYGDESGASWNINNDKYSIGLNYYADTFGGAMSQVMLNVSIW